MTDEQLVQDILAGKREMYYDLVKRYEQKLKRYVGRLINRPHEVDDIVQNVFIKAYKNLPTFQTTLSFSSWIYRIAHNETVNVMSSGFIQKIVSLELIFGIGTTDTTEERMIDDEMKQELKSCVNALDIKYREPIVLFYYEEKTYEEISDILRIPVRAVGVLIHRGKLLIKKICHEKKHR